MRRLVYLFAGVLVAGLAHGGEWGLAGVAAAMAMAGIAVGAARCPTHLLGLAWIGAGVVLGWWYVGDAVVPEWGSGGGNWIRGTKLAQESTGSGDERGAAVVERVASREGGRRTAETRVAGTQARLRLGSESDLGPAPGGWEGVGAGTHVMVELRRDTAGRSWAWARRWMPAGEASGIGWAVERAGEAVRARVALFATESGLPVEQAWVVRALLVGDSGGMPGYYRDLFSATGVSHLLAVSGLHLGLMAGMVFFVVRRVVRWWGGAPGGGGTRAAALVSSLFAGMLLVVTGAPVSCVRAFIMWIGYACARVSDRDYDLWTWLAGSGLVVLAWRPEALFEASFQLSTASVAAIALSAGRTERSNGGGAAQRATGGAAVAWAGRLTGRILEGMRVSAAATAGTLPLVWWHFGTIPLVSVAANLVAVPLVTLWVMPCAAAGVVTWGWGGVLGEAAAVGVRVPLLFLEGVLEGWVEAVPPLSPAWPGWALAGLIGAGVLVLVGFPGWKRWGGAAMLAVGLAGAALASGGDGLEIHVLPVGEGDATVMRLPCGEVWMVDGGPERSGRFTVLPYLRRHGWTRLDGFILTHAHDDHWAGLDRISGALEVDRILHGPTGTARSTVLRLARRWRGSQVTELEAGDGFVRCGVRFDVAWPPDEETAGRSENDTSLVLRLEYGGAELVWAGDVEGKLGLRAAEAVLALRRGREPGLVLIKSPHHGHRSKMMGLLNGMLGADVVVVSGEGERTWPGGLWLAGAGRGGAWVHVTGLDGPFFHRIDRP